jgi:8-oxo-dGTP pyrophosphatase MutT (NUDIX family)
MVRRSIVFYKSSNIVEHPHSQHEGVVFLLSLCGVKKYAGSMFRYVFLFCYNTNMEEILSHIGDPETCAMAVIIKEQRVLLGYRHYQEISLWIPPGGRCDEGETVESTLRREVEEEVGITAFNIKEYLGHFTGTSEKDTVFAFLCDTDQKENLIEPEKFSEWRWFDREEVKTLPMSENTRELISGLL